MERIIESSICLLTLIGIILFYVRRVIKIRKVARELSEIADENSEDIYHILASSLKKVIHK